MSFKSKKLSKNNLGFLKGATLFFLGTSIVLFMANAFEIVPTMPNALQYISQIIFTQDGTNTSMTGIILQGSGGNAWFKGNVSIASLPNKVCLGTDPNGKIVEGICAGGSNSKVGTGVTGKRCIFTGNQVVCDQDTPLTGYTETDPIFSGGDNGKRCTLENGKIECTKNEPLTGETDPIFNTGANGQRCTFENDKIVCNQPAPTGTSTGSQPAGNVTNIQFKDTGDVLSGTNDLVWKNNNLGIDTGSPTEKFQIGNYIWMGQNMGIETGGSFLRIFGSTPGGSYEASDNYSPNIQLNYNQAGNTRNWQIKNKGRLQFNFGTGGEYSTKLAIGFDGGVGIGIDTPACGDSIQCGLHINQKDMYLQTGNFSTINGKIGLGVDINSNYFTGYPTNSMYIATQLEVGGGTDPLGSRAQLTLSPSLMIHNTMKLETKYSVGNIGPGTCGTGTEGTIILISSGTIHDGLEKTHIYACLKEVLHLNIDPDDHSQDLNLYVWKKLDE